MTLIAQAECILPGGKVKECQGLKSLEKIELTSYKIADFRKDFELSNNHQKNLCKDNHIL